MITKVLVCNLVIPFNEGYTYDMYDSMLNFFIQPCNDGKHVIVNFEFKIDEELWEMLKKNYKRK